MSSLTAIVGNGAGAESNAFERIGSTARTMSEQSPGQSEVSDGGESATALASKQTFLTLLVAQIKNQNPLNPADGTEFLSQLAQFSELEQLISIREEVENLGAASRASGPPINDSEQP